MRPVKPLGERRPKRSAVLAWVIFDVGNTMFTAGIVGLFFPLWITQEMSGDDATIGFTLAVAMAVVLFLGPVAGAFSDQTGRKMPFLAVGTLVGIGAILLLGGDNLNLALALFALAVVSINTANIFYSAMLADVSTEATRGTVGGLGAGTGYIGAVIAVVVGLVFVDSLGYVFGFRTVGVLFLLSSIPLFLLLRETPRVSETLTVSEKAGKAVRQLKDTLRHLDRFPGLRRFLIARFWYTLAVNTAAIFAVLYATETVGFSERNVQLVLLVGILVAIPSGVLLGLVVDRIGPNLALRGVLLGWIVILLVGVGIPWLDLPTFLWWGVGAVSGVLVAGLWVADRPQLLLLATPEYLGEFFGLHGTMGRLSAIVGPFTWGFVSVTLDLGQPAAVLILAVSAMISFVLISSLGDKASPRSEAPDRQ